MEYLIYIVLLFEFAAAISATVYYKKYKDGPLKWILLLLWYIPLNEAFCHLLLEWGQEHIFYNIYSAVTSIGLLWITRSQLSNRSRISVINVCIALSITAFIYTAITNDPFKDWPVMAFMASSILIILGLLLYFIEQLKSDYKTVVSRDIFLWISGGFLIFHLSYPVIHIARDILDWKSIAVFDTILIIQFIIILISYSVIAFGFYWGDKNYPKVSQVQ